MEIEFRAIEKRDLLQLQIWRNSDWLRQFMREYRLLNMFNQEQWFEYISTSRDVEMYGIERVPLSYDPGVVWIRLPGLVGVCGLTYINWVNRTAEVSLYVAPKHQEEGIGLQALEFLEHKAFDEFNLHRLWAEIYDFNRASLKLFEKAGFRCEGVLRQHVYKNGVYHNGLMYGLVKDGGDSDL